MSDVERPQVIAQRDDLARCLQHERSASLASACSKRLRIQKTAAACYATTLHLRGGGGGMGGEAKGYL
jgi:hypothetical protein